MLYQWNKLCDIRLGSQTPVGKRLHIFLFISTQKEKVLEPLVSMFFFLNNDLLFMQVTKSVMLQNKNKN
jgi:hypothetical protein